MVGFDHDPLYGEILSLVLPCLKTRASAGLRGGNRDIALMGRRRSRRAYGWRWDNIILVIIEKLLI
jgi:hypothetical protein